MTDYRYALWQKARNRWYAISMALSESEHKTSVIKIALSSGFYSTDAMRSYFLRWGDKMIKHYGKLPYRVLNSSFYEKYMEMK